MAYDANRRAKLARGLKAARQTACLSSTDAARLVVAGGVHCTRGTLLAWERGGGSTSREPFASDLPIIAAVYGCSVECLFGMQAAEQAEVANCGNGSVL